MSKLTPAAYGPVPPDAAGAVALVDHQPGTTPQPQQTELQQLRGKYAWEGDLDAMRRDS